MFKCPVDQKENASLSKGVHVDLCRLRIARLMIGRCSFTQSAPTSFGNRWLLVTTQLRTAGEVLSIQSAASLDSSQRSAGL